MKTTMIEDDSDIHYFADLDHDSNVLDPVDQAESPSTSRTMDRRGPTQIRTNFDPMTPAKSRSQKRLKTPPSRAAAISDAFSKVRLETPQPTKKRSYGPSTPTPIRTKAVKPQPQALTDTRRERITKEPIVISSSDDDDGFEVPIDTESASSHASLTFNRSWGDFLGESSMSSIASSMGPQAIAEQHVHDTSDPQSPPHMQYRDKRSVDSVSSSGSRKRDTESPSENSPSKIRKLVNFTFAKPAQATVESIDEAAEKTLIAQFWMRNTISDLDHFVIAHDHHIQLLLDQHQVQWGTQYELARGVTAGMWQWTDVNNDKVTLLKGPNAQSAYRVRHVMLDKQLRIATDFSLWEELDREQDAIIENAERGLGLQGPYKGDPDWFGGKIQQLAHLAKDSGTKDYKIILEPMEMRRSHRLARYLGSRRILQLRIPDEILKTELEQVEQFLCQRFVLCGRVYVPLHAKEGSAYMVEVDDNFEREPATWCGDQHRRSFREIIFWYNPLELNDKQPISKWGTRFALGLSNSVPVLEFEEENIIHIDDISSPYWDRSGKLPADQCMTDGCGFINAAAALKIKDRLGISYRPTAIQGRIESAKGLWIVHPSDDEKVPRIWIRSSQSKIKLRRPLDKAHRIFDLLEVAQPSSSVSLSMQSIVNLWANNVPDDLLISLLIEGLEADVKPLLAWNGDAELVTLWQTINRLGNVTGTRMQRVAAGLKRALGLKGREWGHEDVGMDDDTSGDSADTTVTDGRNPYSGAPIGLHETAIELLQAGFTPKNSTVLCGKIRHIVDKLIESRLSKFVIPLQQSLDAYIVPDPFGILEPNEVFFRPSQPLIDMEKQVVLTVVLGPVLVGRYPIRLPSDIQKFTAVDLLDLHEYTDVLVVSVKGEKSAASILSGGDYDGDQVFIIREPSIVNSFQSKSLVECPADLVKENFKSHVETVTAFMERVRLMSDADAQKAFLETLVLGLNDSKVGMYSQFHDYAVYSRGYAHRDSIRLAYMFNTILDSSKTGLRLKPEIFENDRRQFNREIPEAPTDKSQRGTTSKPWILHTLLAAGKQKGDDLLKEFDTVHIKRINPDPELKEVYEQLSRQYQQEDPPPRTEEERLLYKILSDELNQLKRHVKDMHDLWLKAVLGQKKESEKPKKRKYRQKEKDPVLHVSRRFHEYLPGIIYPWDIASIKASIAYCEGESFGFSMAFQDLCAIKAKKSSGGIVPLLRAFDEAKTIANSYIRVLNHSSSGSSN